jgi:hypothetical protein
VSRAEQPRIDSARPSKPMSTTGSATTPKTASRRPLTAQISLVGGLVGQGVSAGDRFARVRHLGSHRSRVLLADVAPPRQSARIGVLGLLSRSRSGSRPGRRPSGGHTGSTPRRVGPAPGRRPRRAPFVPRRCR